jgi:hypothetical protein
MDWKFGSSLKPWVQTPVPPEKKILKFLALKRAIMYKIKEEMSGD